jgi:hypothetical protein
MTTYSTHEIYCIHKQAKQHCEICKLQAALAERDDDILAWREKVSELQREHALEIISKMEQIAALTARNKELEAMWDGVQSMSTCTVEYENDLIRANKRNKVLTEALERIYKSADEISDFSQYDAADVDSGAMNMARSIAQAALKEGK